MLRRLRRPVLLIATLPFALVSQGGFLKKMGWFRTLREGRSVDASGTPIPWWSYSFILFIEPRLRSDMRVFEYGSGFSTLWLAQRVKDITSVEISRFWYERLKPDLPANAHLELHEGYVKGGEYGKQIQRHQREFDIVVVDGRDRARCACNAVGALTPGGVIIWDDAQQEQMREAREVLKAQGFRQLDFIGTGPQHHGPHCTVVFYRSENCLGI